jgi:hypothetical protein
MLVGSVWPEGTFKTSLRHRLVLATPSNLRAHFERYQTKTASVPFTMPEETAAPVAPVAPAAVSPPPKVTEEIAEQKVEPKKPAAKPEAKFDPADPFAALSRELGLIPEDNADHDSAANEDAPHGADAPEGLIIPEGLSFKKEEVARLNALDTTAPITTDSGIHESFATEDSAMAEGFISEARASDVAPHTGTQTSTSLHDFERSETMGVDPDATQPSIVRHELPPTPKIAPPIAPPTNVRPPTAPAAQTAPMPPTKPAPPPGLVIPFAPIVTPTQPAMVKPAAPEVAPPPAPTIEANSPKRPVPEATVVVRADETVAAPETEKIARRPLFEPSSETTTTGSFNAPAPPPTARVSSGQMQTGQPQTGSIRKLDSTPVISFFGVGGAAGPSMSKSRSAGDNSGRVVAISKLQPIHLDQCASIDEAGAQAILQACNIFETAMILLFKDGDLQPWKWNDLFLSVKGESPDEIDLQEPSIFKIVFRTTKPYHGYVVTSHVNQKFFNEFNRGMLPKHATVTPIMIDARMGGILLCLTNSKIDYRQSLRLMERLAFDLSRVFKSLRSGAKAS